VTEHDCGCLHFALDFQPCQLDSSAYTDLFLGPFPVIYLFVCTSRRSFLSLISFSISKTSRSHGLPPSTVACGFGEGWCHSGWLCIVTCRKSLLGMMKLPGATRVTRRYKSVLLVNTQLIVVLTLSQNSSCVIIKTPHAVELPCALHT